MRPRRIILFANVAAAPPRAGCKNNTFKIAAARYGVARRKKRVAIMGASGYVGRNLKRVASSRHPNVELVPVSRDGLAGLYSRHRIYDFP